MESTVTAKEAEKFQGIGPSTTFGTQSVTAKRGVRSTKPPSINTLFLVPDKTGKAAV